MTNILNILKVNEKVNAEEFVIKYKDKLYRFRKFIQIRQISKLFELKEDKEIIKNLVSMLSIDPILNPNDIYDLPKTLFDAILDEINMFHIISVIDQIKKINFTLNVLCNEYIIDGQISLDRCKTASELSWI